MSHTDQDALEPIAVVGLSGRFPGARDVDELWTRLLAGEECLTVFSKDEMIAAGADPERVARPDYVPVAGLLEDADCFDAEFFGYSPREAELMDPQHRVFLEEAWAALEHAGHAPRRAAGRIAVFAGAGINLYLAHQLLSDPDLIERAGAYPLAIGNDKDFLATRVSYKLDLRGPSVSVQTACSTSLVAVCMACQSLANAESDVALAGGVTVRAPLRGGYHFQEEGILSPDGHCRAFDAAARGTVPGSGVGVVVLRRLNDALRDGDHVHGLIRGWATNNDGARKVGFTAPSVDGQSEAIAEALAVAGVEPASIGYVEAHGTGTRLGDPVEMASLARVFGAPADGRRTLIGSIKSNLGHLDAAAGVAGLIKALLALRHGEIPPSLHITSPNPELGIERTPFALCSRRSAWSRDGAPRRAGVSSFGIGGTNAHVVLEEAPVPAAKTARQAAPELIVLSAHGEEALGRRAAALAEHLARHPETDLEDAA